MLSLVLAGLVIWAAMRLMRRRIWALRLAIAAVMFWAFVWLSPQIYYAYYTLLFEDLPLQWVARWPELGGVWDIVRFASRDTLADHSKALLFWVLVILALVPRGPRP